MAKEKSKLGIEPVYDVRELGVPKTLVLGVQHLFAMFGATILVPIITGLPVSTALLTAGAGTLFFHLVTGGKVPAFLGSSFAFIAGYLHVGQNDPAKLPYACGGVFVAGFVYIIVAGIIKLVGPKRVMRFFPPVVTGPVIMLIGLVLSPVAIGGIMAPIETAKGVLPAGVNWLIALVSMVTIIVCNLWGRGMLKIIPILMGVITGYVVSILFGVVNFSALKGVGIVGVPVTAAQIMKFDVSAIITIVPIALATMMEHVGDIVAISATVGRNFISKPGLHRTLVGDGVATSLASIVGGPANTTYGENTGVLVLTRVYDPRVMQVAAVMAIVASFLPIVGSAIGTIPGVVINGVSFILYGMITAIGVRNMVENRVDLTSTRNLIVAAVILVSGLGFDVVGGLTFPVGATSINLSGLAIAAILGILLNAILPGKDYEFKEEGEE
ncbi:MAG TPA: uracil-xanthine permease family protein [Bacillota bacterium]|jgi:uracil permease|nr:uracil-xanthine permease [Fastidiosipila sp.]HPX93249.1 uracil-xanthine permease family protein [Bacillota bacterium]HQB81051.1 uracil-xanthine permease family protein [Bacillota bacterium]